MLVQKAQLSKMNLVGRILTRNRKAPRISDLQEEESDIQDECSARKAKQDIERTQSLLDGNDKDGKWTPLDEARTEHQDDGRDTAQGTSDVNSLGL
ncbi:hypothetical protein CGT85_14070 [Vibrio cholerae]|nr:hypothetical protein CGT85_14070 [Vibrio cholerae]